MRFTEIGQQLRAYRLESGLRAEEIAARLGVSRAALYRYEKGEVIKLDTIKRLAELLRISPLSLLGIGVEYYSRPTAYAERIRQVEEMADQILQIHGQICYLTTSDAYDAALAEAYHEAADKSGAEQRSHLVAVSAQMQKLLLERKKMYMTRRPSIIALFHTSALRLLLEQGVAGALDLSEQTRQHCRQVARTEVKNVADLMAAEPIGVQFGLLDGPALSGGFKIMRGRDRAVLCINPFLHDTHPSLQAGVAMITSAEEAISVHQRTAETLWKTAIKGAAAADRIRQLLSA